MCVVGFRMQRSPQRAPCKPGSQQSPGEERGAGGLRRVQAPPLIEEAAQEKQGVKEGRKHKKSAGRRRGS